MAQTMDKQILMNQTLVRDGIKIQHVEDDIKELKKELKELKDHQKALLYKILGSVGLFLSIVAGLKELIT